jgi:exonuclease III
MLKSEGRLEPKSGLPIVKGKIIYRNNLDHGKIDYTVTNRMLAAGFNDSHYLTNKSYKQSAPTKAHAGKSDRMKRIDYIWVNKVMAATVKKAGIIHDSDTDQMSDHYPVFIDCDF